VSSPKKSPSKPQPRPDESGGSTSTSAELRLRQGARRALLLERLTRYLPLPILRASLQAVRFAALLGPWRVRIHDNLKLAFGDELNDRTRRKLSKDCFKHSVRIASEWLLLSHIQRGGRKAERAKRWVVEKVSFDDSYSHLEAALKEGCGVVLATAHIGNWELLGARLASEGTRRGVTPVAIGLDRHGWLRRLRASYGVESLPQNISPRRLLEVLKAGRPIAVLADMEVRRLAGSFLPFFGVDALTMTAPAALARSASCVILPARCYIPPGEDSYRISFDAPLSLRAELSRKEGTLQLMRELNSVYEAWIRETPEQWAWYQPRWRTRPGTLKAIPLHARLDRPELPGAYDGNR
jgi:KDO2-lipid IV(A) lauroyltransferase